MHFKAFGFYFKLFLSLCACCVILFFYISEDEKLNLFRKSNFANKSKPIIHPDIVTIFTKAENSVVLQSSFNTTLYTLFKTTNLQLNIHVFCDFFGCRKADELFSRLKNVRHSTLYTYDIGSAANFVRQKLSAKFLANFRHSSESYYGDALFFVSLILYDFPPFSQKSRILKIDADLKFAEDVAELWRFFDDFRDEQAIGMANEQSPVYRHVFSSYRSQNKETPIGEPPGSGFSGFNSGVTLIDLEKLRLSHEYKSFLINEVKMTRLTTKYKFKGHLGDQDFYTLLSTEFAKFFFTLPCQWNRQLCRWWKDHGYADVFHLYNACSSKPKIFHGNCNTPFPKD